MAYAPKKEQKPLPEANAPAPGAAAAGAETANPYQQLAGGAKEAPVAAQPYRQPVGNVQSQLGANTPTANPYQGLVGNMQGHADAPSNNPYAGFAGGTMAAGPYNPTTKTALKDPKEHGTPTVMTGANVAPTMLEDYGPTATGHVNFSQLYNANSGVSAREANARAKANEAKARGAQTGLLGAQNKFQAGLTGARNGGPSSDDYSYVTGGRQFETDGGPTQPGGEARAKTEGEWRSGLEAGAKAGYSGPNALSAMDEYGKLAQDTAAAQDANQNPLTGLNSTDAALLGAAGRPRFEADKAHYGGLKSDLLKANEASAGKAKAQHEADRAAQAQYEKLLSDYDKAHPEIVKPDEKASDAGAWHPNGAGSYSDFMNAGGVDKAGMHNAGRAMDPLDQFAKFLGENGVYQGEGATDAFSNMFGGQYGAPNRDEQHTANTRNALGDISKAYGNNAAQWLFDHMTQEEWNSYAGMNSGAILRLMRQKIEAAMKSGQFTQATPGSSGGRASETTQAGGGGGAAAVAKEQGTTEEDETLRNQLAMGLGPVTDSSGRSYNSVSEWDAAHRSAS